MKPFFKGEGQLLIPSLVLCITGGIILKIYVCLTGGIVLQKVVHRSKDGGTDTRYFLGIGRYPFLFLIRYVFLVKKEDGRKDT